MVVPTVIGLIYIAAEKRRVQINDASEFTNDNQDNNNNPDIKKTLTNLTLHS
jgi:hypothetical protein